MRIKRTVISLGVSMALVLTGCGTTGSKGEKMTPETSAEETQEETQENIGSSLAKIETTKWNYNAEYYVYWQVGISSHMRQVVMEDLEEV